MGLYTPLCITPPIFVPECIGRKWPLLEVNHWSDAFEGISLAGALPLLPGHHELNSSAPPSLWLFCLCLESANHELNCLKPRAKISCSSFKLRVLAFCSSNGKADQTPTIGQALEHGARNTAINKIQSFPHTANGLRGF